MQYLARLTAQFALDCDEFETDRSSRGLKTDIPKKFVSCPLQKQAIRKVKSYGDWRDTGCKVSGYEILVVHNGTFETCLFNEYLRVSPSLNCCHQSFRLIIESTT